MRKKKRILTIVSAVLVTTLFVVLPFVKAAATSTGAVDMLRLYNPNTGEHFYTADVVEKDTLISYGWKYEGIGWIAPTKSNTPVYRLYNPNAGDHHYTTDWSERYALKRLGWNDEGIGWYSDDDKSVPLYREFNPNVATGTHNYTTNQSEHNSLVSLGWVDEGIGWYGLKETPVPKIESQVIYNENDVKITAKEIVKNGNGWDVNFFIENNTNSNLSIYPYAYAINGLMARDGAYVMDCDVAAGKKANASLRIKESLLKQYGITEVRCVDLLMKVYDKDNYSKSFYTDQIELKTNLYNGGHDPLSGKKLFNDEGIRVVFLSRDGNAFNYAITNTTGKLVSFSFEDLSINDYTNSKTDYNLYSVEILNNCKIVATVNVSDEFLSDNDIKEIEKIEWNLKIRPYDDYFNDNKVGPIIHKVK